MLSTDFNCVGIAGYKLNGVVYWVQDFGYNGIFNKGQIASSNTNSNQVKNSVNTNNVNKKFKTNFIAKNKIFKYKTKTKTKKYTVILKTGKNAVKKVKIYLKIKGKTLKATTNKKVRLYLKSNSPKKEHLKQKFPSKETITTKLQLNQLKLK